jgi:hypothetical protein
MFLLHVFWVSNHDVYSTHGNYFSFRKIDGEEYTDALLAQKFSIWKHVVPSWRHSNYCN